MKSLLSSLMALSLLVFAAGCSEDSSSPVTTGRLKMYMTDAPLAGIEKVNITFSTIEAHINGTWIAVNGAPVTIDLLEWNNGSAMLIGDKELGAGTYTQIRLMVSKAEVVVDGVTKPLTIPSGDETGLKLTHNFDIVAGTTVELVLDFDVAKSITVTGNGEYKLKPTIRVVAKAATGAIKGKVSNPLEVPVVTVSQGGTVIASAIADPVTGEFVVGFLPAGTYDVEIRNALNLLAAKTGVVVTVGAVTDIGTLELK